MIALFFTISPEDLRDYEEWVENYYEDQYKYDRYKNYNRYRHNFIRPIFFNELLSNFVNKLSEEKLKNILIEELRKDEEHTFNNYLKNSLDKNNIHRILNKIINYRTITIIIIKTIQLIFYQKVKKKKFLMHILQVKK